MSEKNEFFKVYTELQKNTGYYFKGRHLINSHTRIDKGVLYIPGIPNGMEATVVDFGKDDSLRNFYYDTLERHRENFGIENGVEKRYILKDVFDEVSKKIKYDGNYGDELIRQYDGKKILIGPFIIDEGRGVCRHQALVTAAVLEKMTDEKLLGGKARINWNLHPQMGGHAWAEYRTSIGEVAILDVAQKYFGYIEGGLWEYWSNNERGFL